MDNDKPKQGKQHLLIGDGTQPSIANGDSWEASEVEPPPPPPKMWRSRHGYNYILEQIDNGAWTYISQWAAYRGFRFGILKQFFDEDNDSGYELTAYNFQLLGHIGYLSELIMEVRYSPHYSARDRCPACWADNFALPPGTLCRGCRDSGDTYHKFINRQTEL